MTAPTAAEMVAAIDTAILARVQGQAIESFGRGDHRFSHYSLEELRKLRDKYQAQVVAANNASTGGLSIATITPRGVSS